MPTDPFSEDGGGPVQGSPKLRVQSWEPLAWLKGGCGKVGEGEQLRSLLHPLPWALLQMSRAALFNPSHFFFLFFPLPSHHLSPVYLSFPCVLLPLLFSTFSLDLPSSPFSPL